MGTTTVETIDETKVKLAITVDAAEVTAAIDAAHRKLASQIKVPGFRPGKAPLKVIESRLGKGAVMEEAARASLPRIYSEAVQELDIDPVGQPRFDVETFNRGQDGEVTATVDVRPTIEVPDYVGAQVPHPEWELTEEELQQNLDAMRERFAEVETVERPAQAGDHVTLTLTGRNAAGDVVDEASTEDFLYEIPEGETDSELDKQLPGSKAGDILSFRDELGPDYGEELAGQTLDFTAIVKEVKATTLPELDDDFALTASEFDTIDELIEDLREQAGSEKRQMARANLRGAVIEFLADQVEIPLPESLVEEEQRFRLSRIAHQAEHNGLTFEQFVTLAAGGDPQELIDQIKAEAEQTVKAQLLVDEIGQQAEITVEQDDLGQEVARQAMRMGRDPQEIAEIMLQPDRIGALYADAYRRKTIDHVLAQVEVTGAPPEELDAADEDDDLDDIEEIIESNTVPVEDAPDGGAADEDAADEEEDSSDEE
ncbi:trigger factor [Euzebya tangerina]|uniref:trigger factor n=1 Tax=Euzebya tangerina TaxID=591198 RepID=UPI000E321D4D|nr:trigger factor [Euzebya tangerina]